MFLTMKQFVSGEGFGQRRYALRTDGQVSLKDVDDPGTGTLGRGQCIDAQVIGSDHNHLRNKWILAGM